MEMNETIFELAFAENGQRAEITDDNYKGGWYSIVGGINGIPTSQQFNAIMYAQEIKVNYLYRLLKEIDFNLDDIEKAFNEVFLLDYIPYANVIEKAFRKVYTQAPKIITADTGYTWEDYGAEISFDDMREIICADWDGVNPDYYDCRAEAAEKQFYAVFNLENRID